MVEKLPKNCTVTSVSIGKVTDLETKSLKADGQTSGISAGSMLEEYPYEVLLTINRVGRADEKHGAEE